jgi:squalene synthase HpnC
MAAAGKLKDAGRRQAVAPLPGEGEVLARAPGENFSVASLLLSRRVRRHLMAVYGYARLVDELGDSVAGDRLAALDELEADLGRLFDPGEEPRHPVLVRLAPSQRELGFPQAPFLALIEANRLDQTKTRYASYDELLHYCTLSANPVGELVLYVFGVATPERIALSDAVCTALQLVEHWQDVGEDFAAGRVYLPADDLDRYGVAETDLGAAHAGPALVGALEFEVARARNLLDRGARLVGTLRGTARVAVAGYVGGGRAALDAIERAGYDVLAGPPRAGRAARLVRSLSAYRRGA